MNFGRSYYYGEHRWEDYVLDIQDSINAAGERQVDELQRQSEEMARQTAQLGGIRDGLEEMRGEVRWGFNLVVDRMDQQIGLFSRALEALDEIHRTLRSPLMTQAKELFDWGEERFRKDLYDKALEAFLHSEQKNEVNFLLQLRIGTLFLEGKTADCCVIDLPRAEKHLLLAARYAQAEDKVVFNWNVFCGEAYYRAGVAAYLIGEQKYKSGDAVAKRACLERALEHFARALAVRPEFTGTVYSKAKCYALLGRTAEALEMFQILSDRDRRYHANVLEDGDFETIRADIEQVFRLAIENPGKQARAAEKRIGDALKALTWAKRSNPDSTTDIAAVAWAKGLVKTAPQLLQGLDVDVDHLNVELVQTTRSLADLTDGVLRTRASSLHSQIGSLTARRHQSEQFVEGLGKMMRRTRIHPAWGCLSVVVALFGTSAVFAMLLPLLVLLLGKEYAEGTTVVMGIAGTVIGGFVGVEIVRWVKNQPLRDEGAARAREIDDCSRQIPPLQRSLDAVEKQLAEFSAWRSTLDISSKSG